MLVTFCSHVAMIRDVRRSALGRVVGVARRRRPTGPLRRRPAGLDHPEVSVGYLKTEGGGFGKEATACELVGDTGIEPVTSSV